MHKLPQIPVFENEKIVSADEAIEHMLKRVKTNIKMKHGLIEDENLAIRLYTLEWKDQNKTLRDTDPEKHIQ